MHGGCRCSHHIFVKILSALGFVSAVLFFYAAWAKTLIFGFDSTMYFEHVIVLSLMVYGTKYCGCCGGRCGCGRCGEDKISSCACSCGSCEGGKCDSVHPDNHQHK